MAFPPNTKQIEFRIGATPITNPILMQCSMDIPTLQALIDANIIVAGWQIFITGKTALGFTFNVSTPATEQITATGHLIVTTNESVTDIPFNFICSFKQNRLLVITKMLAGLKNNP